MKIESYKDCMRLTSGDSQKASKLWAVLKDGDSIDDSDAFQQLPTPQVDVDGAISRISSHVEMNLNNYKHEMTDEVKLHLDAMQSRISQYGNLIRKFTDEYPKNKIGNGNGDNMDDVQALCTRCRIGFSSKEFKENNGLCPECNSPLMIRRAISGKPTDDEGNLLGGIVLGSVGATGVVLAIQNWDKITKFFDEFLTDMGISSPRYSPRSSTRRKSSYRPVVRQTETKEILPLNVNNKIGTEKEEIDSLLRTHDPQEGAEFPYSE